ncbi:MAG TPA: MFS transporter [Acetobacteraceae bacterium]|nr:MFS transporter [Acetobacteraceae bacterium]
MQKQVSAQIGTISPAEGATFAVVGALALSHLLNDTMQSLMPALYPMLKQNLGLDFGQVGLITLCFQITASLLQPVVGIVTDRRPMPYSLAIGMGFTLCGLLLLSVAPSLPMLLLAAATIGMGSAVFHPEASRMARYASGGRHGLAQSVFQVGGNAGSALGPLLAAFVVLPEGQRSVAWFSLAALTGMAILSGVGRWFVRHQAGRKSKARTAVVTTGLSRRRVMWSLAILVALIFSKFFYMASIGTYFTFYLMHRFGVSIQAAQVDLFIFLAAAAAGTFFGGPLGDRIGRKYVIWMSIAGVLPFTLALPYAGLTATLILIVPIGLILSSAFSAIIVYAQELMPGKVGMVSGLFFGFAFGMGGLGAAALGELADMTSIDMVYRVCAFLPAIGLLTAFLPNLERRVG